MLFLFYNFSNGTSQKNRISIIVDAVNMNLIFARLKAEISCHAVYHIGTIFPMLCLIPDQITLILFLPDRAAHGVNVIRHNILYSDGIIALVVIVWSISARG